MKAHPTMEILPFGDAYLVAGCLVLKGLSPRGAVPKSGMQWLPADHQQRQAPRCCEQAGWQATGAAGKPFGDLPCLSPAPQGAGTPFAGRPGQHSAEGAGRVEPPALAKQPCTPGCWHGRGGRGSPSSRSSPRPWESCQQPQELCSPLGIWDSS